MSATTKALYRMVSTKPLCQHHSDPPGAIAGRQEPGAGLPRVNNNMPVTERPCESPVLERVHRAEPLRAAATLNVL